MAETLLEMIVLVRTDCCVCGVAFAMPRGLLDERREKGGNFYCPNGHSLVYTKPEVQRLKEQLDWATARNRHLEDQRDASDRSRVALKGANTKLRKRIAAGVCPCCHRSFKDLARHMAGQHPKYAAGEIANGGDDR